VEEENSPKGFKVEDRRRFSADGEARPDAPESTTASVPPEPGATAAESPASEPARPQAPPLPEMTFSTFVIGLSTQALVLLGEIPDPATRSATADLAGAKQLIDILGMLQAKTRGNLDEAESGLVDAVLYDLRMKYVERARPR
jgi:hypothetical protein